MSALRSVVTKRALRSATLPLRCQSVAVRRFSNESHKLVKQTQGRKAVASFEQSIDSPYRIPVPATPAIDKTGTMPRGHPATVGHLDTFTLPETVRGTAEDVALGTSILNSLRRDGIFQIQIPRNHRQDLAECYARSKAFFNVPHAMKSKHVDDQSFAGYIASGEELTDGIADYSEIFTVTKDLEQSDARVQEQWPCHGPCPWPSESYGAAMNQQMANFGGMGEQLLELLSLALGLQRQETLTDLTKDGWHHMRILRFPAENKTNGKGKPGRGIGAHTDYGLLVIASQDEVGGLFVRRPMGGAGRNWEKSTAGANEMDDQWTYVPPVENVYTVFTGDMMQYLTSDIIHSTPHKVGLNTRERFAFAYFHEPNFSATVKPLPEFSRGIPDPVHPDGIMYGEHFTNMFMRNYAERVTAKRMLSERRMDKLPQIKRRGQDGDFRAPV